MNSNHALEILNKLDNNKCKRILNFLAVKAFGKNSTVIIDKCEKYYKLQVVVNHTSFYLLSFCMKDPFILSVFFHCSPSWKDVLRRLFDVVADGGFVSYLCNKPHLIDPSTCLEEVLVEEELSLVAELE